MPLVVLSRKTGVLQMPCAPANRAFQELEACKTPRAVGADLSYPSGRSEPWSV